MKDLAVKNFLNGYSCSEAVVMAAIQKGYVHKDILAVATPFSGGMGVRCVCGAVSGAMIVLGSMFGRNDERDSSKGRSLAKEFNEKFSAKYKVNCCKVLSAGYEMHSAERKQHCTHMVHDSGEILESLIKENSLVNN